MGNNINNNNYWRGDDRIRRAAYERSCAAAAATVGLTSGTRRKQDELQNTWPRGRVPEPTELRDENMCRRNHRRRCRSDANYSTTPPPSLPTAQDRRLSRSPAAVASSAQARPRKPRTTTTTTVSFNARAARWHKYALSGVSGPAFEWIPFAFIILYYYYSDV